MKNYVKKGVTPMEPWTSETNMDGVSVTEEDTDNGSPKQGDMIATNPNNPADRWLVAEAYFIGNYMPAGEEVLLPEQFRKGAVIERVESAIIQALEYLPFVSNLRYLSTFECQHYSPSDCYEKGAGAACNSCWARTFARAILKEYEDLFKGMKKEVKDG